MIGDDVYRWWCKATNEQRALLLSEIGDDPMFVDLLADDCDGGWKSAAAAVRRNVRDTLDQWRDDPPTTLLQPLYRAMLAAMTPERTAQYMATHANRERPMDRLDADVRNAQVEPVMQMILNAAAVPAPLPAGTPDPEQDPERWDAQS
jgi:hypothetical protein